MARDGEKRSASDLARSDLVPIRHYKLFNLLMVEDFKNRERIGAYHHETQGNLVRLMENLDERLGRLGLCPTLRCWQGFECIAIPTPGMQIEMQENPSPEMSQLHRAGNH